MTVIKEMIGRQLSGYLNPYHMDVTRSLEMAMEIDEFLYGGSRPGIVMCMLIRGHTQEEVADVLGITRMTVSRDVRRARKYLRERI